MHDNALFLDIAKHNFRIDHPAPRDLRTSIKALNQFIQGVKDPSFSTSKAQFEKGKDGCLSASARAEYDSTLRAIRVYEDKRDACETMLKNGAYYLGHVVAGSGMNRT